MSEINSRDSKLGTNSAVISCSPLRTGLGTYSRLLYDLDLFGSLVFFRKSSRSDESGYENVVKPDHELYNLRALLSVYGISFWKKYIQGFGFLHLTSPEFFHLVRYNRNMTGTVHDLQPIDDHVSRSAYSYAFIQYMKKNYSAMGDLKGVVAISNVTAEIIRDKVPDVNPVVIHHWTDDRFVSRDRDLVRKKLGLDTDARYILNVSSPEPRKGLDQLPKIMASLPDNFRLIRIGKMAPALEGIRDRRFINIDSVSDEDYPLYFSASDVYFSPSIREGFGRPTIEAINSSLPVVLSDIPINREIVRDSKFLVDPENPENFTEKILQAADMDAGQKGSLYSNLGDYYRKGRALRQYQEFYGRLGES
ncbi:MAG: glycosyltransferase [Thermoplasmataceae archaeon]